MSRWLFAVVVNAWVANAADTPARAPSMPVKTTVVPVDWKYSSSAYDPITVKWGERAVFEWNPEGEHDLMYFRDEAAYDNCDFEDDPKSAGSSGWSTEGMAAGTYYLGCSRSGYNEIRHSHCVNGYMKIKVTIEPKPGKGGKAKGGKAKKGYKKQKPGKGSKKGGKKPKPEKGYGSKKGKGGKGGKKGDKVCCQALKSSCLACAAGQKEQEYCEMNPTTTGCEDLPPKGEKKSKGKGKGKGKKSPY